MVDKGRVGRFLRTLVGLLLVAWLLAALFSPPDPSTFLLYLVPGWVLATVGAAWLVYAGGYRTLRESPAYNPRAPASRATAAFVGVAVVLKVVLTAGADLLLGEAAVGHGEGLVVSAMALVVAYVAVFWAGLLGEVPGTGETPDG